MPAEMKKLTMFKAIMDEADVMDALSATAVIKNQLRELQQLGGIKAFPVKIGRTPGFEDTPVMKRLKTDMKNMAKTGHDMAKDALHLMSKETTDATEAVDETADPASKKRQPKKKKGLTKLKSKSNIYRRCPGDAVRLMKREIATRLHL